MSYYKELKWTVNENGCHICISHYLDKDGYPRMNVNRKAQPISRVVYSRIYLDGGEIPKGLLVRHKCDNPSCINPLHLEIGTSEDNSRDMVKRGRAGHSKLTEQMVKDIFYSKGTVRAIATLFSINNSVVCLIKNRKIWKHINVQYIAVI
jgi:hypothetical protein